MGKFLGKYHSWFFSGETRKALKYLPNTSVDIAERELARSYASFTLPKTSEGFDQVAPWIYLEVGNRRFESILRYLY